MAKTEEFSSGFMEESDSQNRVVTVLSRKGQRTNTKSMKYYFNGFLNEMLHIKRERR